MTWDETPSGSFCRRWAHPRPAQTTTPGWYGPGCVPPQGVSVAAYLAEGEASGLLAVAKEFRDEEWIRRYRAAVAVSGPRAWLPTL